jgi:hypothetical protein
MQIGHILEGFYEDRIHQFEKEYFSKPDCNYQSCKNEHCFECPASDYILNKGMNNKQKNLCHLLSIEREIFMDNIKKVTISEYDIRTFWNVGTSVVESHYTDKMTAKCNLQLTDSREYTEDDKMLVSNNIERIQSW